MFEVFAKYLKTLRWWVEPSGLPPTTLDNNDQNQEACPHKTHMLSGYSIDVLKKITLVRQNGGMLINRILIYVADGVNDICKHGMQLRVHHKPCSIPMISTVHGYKYKS